MFFQGQKVCILAVWKTVFTIVRRKVGERYRGVDFLWRW
jgi:hypothetical protein